MFKFLQYLQNCSFLIIVKSHNAGSIIDNIITLVAIDLSHKVLTAYISLNSVRLK